MISGNELIASIITPPGEGGIGAIRVAGAGSREFCAGFLAWNSSDTDTTSPFYLKLTKFIIPESGEVLDEVMAVWMPSGKSYTGDEQVEIYCHGGRVVLLNVLRALYAAGARAAEPGEFTKRAFLAGRIDLTKAEAVAEMIAANSQRSYSAARDNLLGQTSQEVERLRSLTVKLAATFEAQVDFPEEEIDPDEHDSLIKDVTLIRESIQNLVNSYRAGIVIRDGFKIALCGRPNAGKSSLFNALLKKNRAIISSTPGTTRDYLSEWIELGGFAIEITDTAGLRTTTNEIEVAGQKFASELANASDMALWLVDCSYESWRDDIADDILPETTTIVACNKIDLPGASPSDLPVATCGGRNCEAISISCKTEQGIEELERRILAKIESALEDQTDGKVVTNERHKEKLAEALESLQAVSDGLDNHVSPELVAFDLKAVLRSLDEITGKVYTDDLLEVVFSSFCIGK
jgi:tRNA modification GTPase